MDSRNNDSAMFNFDRLDAMASMDMADGVVAAADPIDKEFKEHKFHLRHFVSLYPPAYRPKLMRLTREQMEEMAAAHNFLKEQQNPTVKITEDGQTYELQQIDAKALNDLKQRYPRLQEIENNLNKCMGLDQKAPAKKNGFVLRADNMSPKDAEVLIDGKRQVVYSGEEALRIFVSSRRVYLGVAGYVSNYPDNIGGLSQDKIQEHQINLAVVPANVGLDVHQEYRILLKDKNILSISARHDKNEHEHTANLPNNDPFVTDVTRVIHGFFAGLKAQMIRENISLDVLDDSLLDVCVQCTEFNPNGNSKFAVLFMEFNDKSRASLDRFAYDDQGVFQPEKTWEHIGADGGSTVRITDRIKEHAKKTGTPVMRAAPAPISAAMLAQAYQAPKARAANDEKTTMQGPAAAAAQPPASFSTSTLTKST